MSMKNYNDIGNRTRDLPVCSAMPGALEPLGRASDTPGQPVVQFCLVKSSDSVCGRVCAAASVCGRKVEFC
jgi:hypothetical protein